jgi:hypothetical protein
MRDNGVGAFPDPDASGELTIDGVLNGSSLDSSTAAWKQAIGTCKDLQPPGFTGRKVTPEQRKPRLEFAQCIRDHGVKDFPDPADDEPLVDTNRIPSAATEAGMSILHAAMQRCRDFGAAAGRPGANDAEALGAGRSGCPGCRNRHGSVVVTSGAKQASAASQEPLVNTARVEKGRLSDMVSQYGTLTYRARSDGSPYAVINRACGTYTKLPISGDRVDCGDVLYRVNDDPVLLLCGSTPAYRSLAEGDSGSDVAELNANLVALGYASRAQLDPSSESFGSATASALEKLQSSLGDDQTGSRRGRWMRSVGSGTATVRPCCSRASGAATSTSTTSGRSSGDPRRRLPGSRRCGGSTISGTPSRPSRSVPASQPSTSPATWAPA